MYPTALQICTSCGIAVHSMCYGPFQDGVCETCANNAGMDGECVVCRASHRTGCEPLATCFLGKYGFAWKWIEEDELDDLGDVERLPSDHDVASELQMVEETDNGLRYLEKEAFLSDRPRAVADWARPESTGVYLSLPMLAHTCCLKATKPSVWQWTTTRTPAADDETAETLKIDRAAVIGDLCVRADSGEEERRQVRIQTATFRTMECCGLHTPFWVTDIGDFVKNKDAGRPRAKHKHASCVAWDPARARR